MQPLVAAHFPQVRDAIGAEWWAHSRVGGGGHGLHFDTDEAGLRSCHTVRHPAVSSVLYLSRGGGGSSHGGGASGGGGSSDSGCKDGRSSSGGDTALDAALPASSDGHGPTLITDQRLNLSPAKTAWLAWPRENRLCLFDGALLHGVLPALPPALPPYGEANNGGGIGSSGVGNGAAEEKEDHGAGGERRLTLMIGWWLHDVRGLPARNGELGPNMPMPAPGGAAGRRTGLRWPAAFSAVGDAGSLASSAGWTARRARKNTGLSARVGRGQKAAAGLVAAEEESETAAAAAAATAAAAAEGPKAAAVMVVPPHVEPVWEDVLPQQLEGEGRSGSVPTSPPSLGDVSFSGNFFLTSAAQIDAAVPGASSSDAMNDARSGDEGGAGDGGGEKVAESARKRKARQSMGEKRGIPASGDGGKGVGRRNRVARFDPGDSESGGSGSASAGEIAFMSVEDALKMANSL
ncbi:unnamed protein product [Phaeothamnion confervicola]